MKIFEAPRMEIVGFNTEDILTTSGCDLCAPDCQEVGDYPDNA